MKVLISVYLLVFASQYGYGNCLPSVSQLKLPESHFSCHTRADCVLIAEACRSCQKPIAINKLFEQSFIEADMNARKSTNCVLSCEACDLSKIKVECKKSICSVI